MYLKRPFSAVSSKDPEVCETAEKEEEKEHPHKPIVDFPRRWVFDHRRVAGADIARALRDELSFRPDEGAPPEGMGDGQRRRGGPG